MKTIEQEARNEIVNIFKDLNNQYVLPKCEINDEEWDAFCKVFSQYFTIETLGQCLSALNIIMRRSFALRNLDNSKTLTFDHLLNALDVLSAFHFLSDQIDEIRTRIKKEISKNATQKTINNP